MSMLKPKMGEAIAASESGRVLTIAMRFVRIGLWRGCQWRRAGSRLKHEGGSSCSLAR